MGNGSGRGDPGLRERVRAWIADDPDPDDRAELKGLLAGADRDGQAGAAARAELADRFAGRLEFGTAGLRGAMGAGPARMNRAVVLGATAGLARWLHGHRPEAARAGVVLGWDARHRSAGFARQATAVLTGAGLPVHLLPGHSPTPLLAFAVRHLGAAAGVMITASHNPPADNGYKLYLGDGAQIIPPVDTQIEALIAGLGPLSGVPLGPLDGPLVTRHGDEIAQAYLEAVVSASPATVPASPATVPASPATPGGMPPRAPAPASPRGRPGPLRVVYTPLHGVAGALMVRAIERAGFPAPHVVAAQADPDPDFPTVPFPNPEEPGALDLAVAQARRLGADLVLASDPDGDRLAVAVPDPRAAAGWRVLTGDQVGALLGAFILDVTAGDADPAGRLVATTIVSSALLSRIAAAAGAGYAETLTGFKWIVRAAEQVDGARFAYGYEEALGYAVGEVVRDKDGIGAALAVLGLATVARAAGQDLLSRWDALEAAHGVHLRAALTVPTRSPAAIMARLRAHPPATLGAVRVARVVDLLAGTPGTSGARVARVSKNAPGIELAGDAGRPEMAGGAGREDRVSQADGTDGPTVAGGASGNDRAGQADRAEVTGRASGNDRSGRADRADGADGPEAAARAGGDDRAGRAGGGRLPPSDVLIFELDGARVVVRPSGTEPKLKAYLEVTGPPSGPAGLAAARDAAGGRMGPLRAAVSDLLLGPGAPDPAADGPPAGDGPSAAGRKGG